MININIQTNKFWKKYENGINKLWFKGYLNSHSIENLFNTFKVIKEDEISSFVLSLEGHFAFIFQRDDFVFLAVDKIRSCPLFFTKIKNDIYIDNNPNSLVHREDFNTVINESAKIEMAMSGFTIGNKTLFKNLHSLKAGEIVMFKNNKFKYVQYYRYFGEIFYQSFDDYLKELSAVTLKIFKNILNNIGDRQIIIPLSGGSDSRLIASILRHLGAKNVKCYSYGTPSNFESKIAKKVSKKLGYEWIFIPLTIKSEKKYYSSKEYQDFLKFSETFSAVPFIQSLSSVKYLKRINWIKKDAIFINGLSGDFISGGHTQESFSDNFKNTSELRQKNIINQLIDKHFSLWGYLKINKDLDDIRNSLSNEIKSGCGDFIKTDQDHLTYEYAELIGRQSKYVLKKQRIYEFYGYDWRLPFWDDQYLYFWQKVPLKYKLKQKLYKEMLKKNNYGDVWGDDFIANEKAITPKWIIPLRIICKIPFSFFGIRGRKAWKQFDINFFKYFMSIPHTWDMFNYFRIIKDIFKKPRNSVSWQVKDYLKNLTDRKD